MNKEKYLAELEELLTKNKVNNLYSIVRDYSNKIDIMIANGYSFDEIIDDIGTPREAANSYLENNFEKKLDDIEEKLEKFVDDIGDSFEKKVDDIEENIDKEFDNDPDEVFEKDYINNEQFKKSRFEKRDREKNKEMYDNQFEYNNRFQREEYESKQYNNRFKQSGSSNPDLVRNILYIIIALLVIALIFRAFKYFFLGGVMGYGFTHSMWGSGLFGFFSIIPTLIIIGVVVYILRKNNRK